MYRACRAHMNGPYEVSARRQDPGAWSREEANGLMLVVDAVLQKTRSLPLGSGLWLDQDNNQPRTPQHASEGVQIAAEDWHGPPLRPSTLAHLRQSGAWLSCESRACLAMAFPSSYRSVQCRQHNTCRAEVLFLRIWLHRPFT